MLHCDMRGAFFKYGTFAGCGLEGRVDQLKWPFPG
ncbi:hypothetical protein P3T22_002925 [Paraburkholderia sp. GAS348]